MRKEIEPNVLTKDKRKHETKSKSNTRTMNLENSKPLPPPNFSHAPKLYGSSSLFAVFAFFPLGINGPAFDFAADLVTGASDLAFWVGFSWWCFSFGSSACFGVGEGLAEEWMAEIRDGVWKGSAGCGSSFCTTRSRKLEGHCCGSVKENSVSMGLRLGSGGSSGALSVVAQLVLVRMNSVPDIKSVGQYVLPFFGHS
jgi:hypothetical protein